MAEQSDFKAGLHLSIYMLNSSWHLSFVLWKGLKALFALICNLFAFDSISLKTFHLAYLLSLIALYRVGA